MKSNFRAEIALRIKAARKRKGLSQVMCAKELQVARQTYLDMESGKTDPKVSLLVDFSNLVGVSVHYLIYGENAFVRLDKSVGTQHGINTLVDTLSNESPETIEFLIDQMMHTIDHLKKLQAA